MKELTPDEISKPRKRRLRKKLRVGEFQELGFEVEIRFAPGDEPAFDDALDAWIEFVESRSWLFGGGGTVDLGKLGGFVVKDGRGTLTEADRAAAEAWLKEAAWVEGFQVGSLKDAWHGW